VYLISGLAVYISFKLVTDTHTHTLLQYSNFTTGGLRVMITQCVTSCVSLCCKWMGICYLRCVKVYSALLSATVALCCNA